MLTRRLFIKTLTTAAGLSIINPMDLPGILETMFRRRRLYSIPAPMLPLRSIEAIIKEFYIPAVADMFQKQSMLYDAFWKLNSLKPGMQGKLLNIFLR